MAQTPRVEQLHRNDDTLSKVAFLHAEGVPQKRIATLLSLSPSMVCRLVKKAKEEGLLRQSVECTLQSEEKDRLHEEIFESDALLKKLRNFAYDSGVAPVSHVRIVPTGVEIRGDPSWDQAVAVFGRKAAAYCLDLILKCQVLGATYGRTLAALINGLEELSTPPFKSKERVDCVPLWGEPLSPWEEPTSTIFRDPAKLSSTGVAAALHRIVNARVQSPRGRSGQQALCLDFVPAFRPERYPKEKFDAVLEFACSVSSYGDIFPVPRDWLLATRQGKSRSKRSRSSTSRAASPIGKRPLVDHLDGILTSAGSKDQPGRFWSGEFFRQGDIDIARLRRGALGDLGGAFIINPKAKKADRDYVAGVNERWTGIKENHFRRCALRAREHGLPGVVLLAVGAVRADVVRECVKLGLTTRLILCSECASKLGTLL